MNFNMLYIRNAINQFFKKASVILSGKDRYFLMLFLLPKMRILLVTLLFIFQSSYTYSQNLDSLLTAAKEIKNDSVRIRTFNKIGFSYIFNDSDKALQVITEGKTQAKESGFNFGLAELTNTHGIYMDVTGKSDSAKYYFTKALDLSHEHNFKNIEVMCINNLGMFHWNRSEYDDALRFFFDALRMNDAIGDEKQSHTYLNNIGLIYQEMNLNEKALSYHEKALKIREEHNLENDQITSLNNIGINLKDLGRIDEAIMTYKKGLVIAKRTNNLIEYYRLLDNLANAYNENNNYDLAIKTYLQALDKPEGFESDEASELSTYSNLTALYNEINEPQTALGYAEKGFKLIQKYPQIKANSGDLNLNTAESYYMLRNFKKAREHTHKFRILKDSIFSEKNAQAIADLEVKYDTEKKEKEILIQRAELAEHKLTIQKQNYQLYGVVCLAVVLGLIGYLFFNQQKLKNKQLKKENELKDALIKIETQNKLQEQRLRISRDLHDNIGAQLTFIISSIDNLKYGFDIKDETLNKRLESISNFTSETIYELRDTIWAMNKEEITIEDLILRITNYKDKARFASQEIEFNINVSNKVDIEKSFSSVTGIGIHRVVQEAVHNAIKHAKATKIEISIDKPKNYKLSIIDNGKGFDLNTIEKGNGLTNMKKRVNDLGGEFSIDSKLNEGTIISLTFPN